MIVEQVWTANAYRNFNDLIACPESGEALAIDPLDHKKCLARAKDKGWDITQVLNTHEHGDHTGGNTAVIAATGARLLAHAGTKDKIPGMFDCPCPCCPGVQETACSTAHFRLGLESARMVDSWYTD